MKCDIFKGHATCECCEGAMNWNFCPFDGTKLKKHRKIEQYSLDELLKSRVISEDGLICIVRNRWISDAFIGRIVAIKNDESDDNIDLYTITDASEDQNWMQLESNDGVKRMRYGKETNEYANSNIRKWLNNEFYHGFSIDFQEIIRAIPIKITDKSNKSVVLEDLITIPSAAEICSDAKWFENLVSISDTDKQDGHILPTRKHIKRMGWYWTRTRSNGASNVWSVGDDGDVYNPSSYSSTNGCVVPVFRIGQSKQ